MWLGYSFMSQRGYLIFIGPIMGQDSAHGSDLQLSFIFGISSSHRSCGCTRFTQNQWWFHLYLYQPVFSIPDTLLRLTALKNVKSTALVSLLIFRGKTRSFSTLLESVKNSCTSDLDAFLIEKNLSATGLLFPALIHFRPKFIFKCLKTITRKK